MKKFLHFLIIYLVTACTSIPSGNISWRTGISNNGIFNDSIPDQLPSLKWKFLTGGMVLVTPVISGELLYAGSDDSLVYALHKTTGKTAWVFRSDGKVRSSVTIADGKAFFLTTAGTCYAVDALHGSLAWTFHYGNEHPFTAPNIHGVNSQNKPVPDPYDLFLSSPQVKDNKLFFGAGDGKVYGINEKDGKRLWAFQTGDVVHSTPALAGDTLYIGSWDSYLYALKTEDGKEIWRFKTGIDSVYFNQQGFQSSPVVVNGTVYTGCRDAHLYAINQMTGLLKWKYFANYSWINATPAIENGMVFAGTSDTHQFLAFSADSGKQIYTGNTHTYMFSSPSVAVNGIVLGNNTGDLVALNKLTGKELWTYETDGHRMNASLYLDEKGLPDYKKLMTQEGYPGMVEAVERMFSMGSVIGSAWIENRTIYFGSTDHNIYAVH